MANIRIGVIGVGFGATVHIPAYQLEGLEVVAVCASREERAKDAAQRFGIPHTFTDYHEMLKMDGLDAVTVAGPQAMHHEMTMAVLAAGKHLICEKPMTNNLDHAREMWQAAEASSLTTMIAHEFRFSPARAHVKELIDDGYLGPLHMVMVSIVQPPRQGFGVRPHNPNRDFALGGGLLWSQGSHYFDCLRHWFGEVSWVSGKTFAHLSERKTESGEIIHATADDAFVATFGFADGGWANVLGNFAAAHGPGVRVELYGGDGTLVTPQDNVGSPNPPPHPRLLGGKVSAESLSEIPIPERLDPYDDEGHDGFMPMRMLAREFVRGIQQGKSPAPNLYDGYRCQQLLHAVVESGETGRVVKIPAER